MNRTKSPASGYRRAFTLVETLLAMALFTGLLVASTAVLIQVSQAWASQADDPIVDRHAEGLERFIRRVFAESTATGLTAPTADQVSSEGALLAVRPPSDLPWTDLQAIAGGVITGRLAIPPDDDGLWLYWNAANESTRDSSNEPHRILLSPWVREAQVYVYDATGQKWMPADPATPVDNVGGVGTATIYRVLRLVIVRNGQTRTLEIPMPRSS